MKTLLSTSLILATLLVLPAVSEPAAGASLPRHWAAVQRHNAMFAKAKALAPPAVSAVSPQIRTPETDGLSRNDEDCAFGCIDH